VPSRSTSAAERLLRRPCKDSHINREWEGLSKFFVQYFRSNQRAFPWRNSVETFSLLVAELLLVQTKADDVARIWPTLIRRYPTAEKLAKARRNTLEVLLSPLGLQRQRAKALKSVAAALSERHRGEVPAEARELLALPYVGLYVASALRAFAFARRTPIVDANVLRVFERVTGVHFGKDARRAPQAWEFAWSILPTKNTASHNYGILDFAAQICKKAPQCERCGLHAICAYRKTLHGPIAS
jgi:A/G-specific adenine glycosylase